MKTKLISFILAVAASIGTICATEGALSGLFSVSADKQVYFSKGNLQYQFSTDTWRFSENQYDYVGEANSYINSSYDGWIDLFCWGTGNNPTNSSTDYNDFSTFVDWGVNAISNGGNEANLWRTLTNDEWGYLFNTRENASTKYGMASIGGINGIIILPDNYKGTTINTAHSAWDNNTISTSDWAAYEANGAIFLPAAGDRGGTDVEGLGSDGYYWSSTPLNTTSSYTLYFYSNSVGPQMGRGRSTGRSVRLVQEKANSQTGGNTPLFPDDPGTLTYNLELKAAVVDGDELPDYVPSGGGGYAKGSSVTITAQDIPGYQFVQWSDSVTEQSRTVVVNQSTTLTAYYNRSQIEITVAANAWTFFCLPAIGKDYTEDMFEYVGLTGVKWGTYNGATRAAGKSGWETPENFNAQQGYIIYSTTAGTLRINAYMDEVANDVTVSLTDHSSSQPENSGWNFLGNPYSQGYSIAGLAAAGIESPITVWNGTGYDTYTPGIDTYILQPFEAFFIQKAEGGAESVNFSPEHANDQNLVDEYGTLPGYFSVSSSKKVRFSRGNLQYQASTDTWRFATNQWDNVGNDNKNISDTYSGWIDLFGWGTGSNPTLHSESENDYPEFSDWGSNPISNGGREENLWRTLSQAEWLHIFNTRNSASSLRSQATVCGVHGYLLLPDEFTLPEGLTWTPQANNWTANVYEAQAWKMMENNGAVFLPSCGYRMGSSIKQVGEKADYWSTSSSSATMRSGISCYSTSAGSGNCSPAYGRAVRLVR